jgi:SAM-dependent methyltransferase
MSQDLTSELADYFQVSPEILPFIPELLADLWALGGDPELIVEWLRPLGHRGGSARVLELGCGKGANAIAVAQHLGLEVDGVDAFEPFVREARQQARRHGVEELCRFRVGDVREEVGRLEGFDVVLFISVGGVLGSPRETVAALRRVIRPGGHLILDDGWRLSEDCLDSPGYEYLLSREETMAQLLAHGDALVREKLISTAEVVAQDVRFTELIERRAKALAERHPEHADAFLGYIKTQEEECRVLETAVQCATWMLQRSTPTPVASGP